MSTTNWTVEIQTDEHDGQFRATARLAHLGGSGPFGTGVARIFPPGNGASAAGNELAAGRALADLGRRLMDAAADLDLGSHRPAALLW